MKKVAVLALFAISFAACNDNATTESHTGDDSVTVNDQTGGAGVDNAGTGMGVNSDTASGGDTSRGSDTTLRRGTGTGSGTGTGTGTGTGSGSGTGTGTGTRRDSL